MLELLGLFFLAIVLGEYEERQKLKHHRDRTTSIKILFTGDQTMSAPTGTVGTTNNGSPLFALIEPLQSTGATSNGVVSAASFTILDTTVIGVTSQGASPSGIVFAQLTPLKIGSTTLNVSCTVTDPDGTVNTFTATATVNVIAGPNDTLTASVEILFSSTQPS